MGSAALQVIDGPVPCVWHETDDDAVEAGLIIGAGFADERLAEHGLSHLAEHLISDACRHLPATRGAHVTTLHMGFHGRGTAAEVEEYFAAIAAAIRDLPTERMAHEVRVLTAERRERPPGLAAELDMRRYGPHGPGLDFWPEYGLRRQADGLRAFAADRLVAPRAVAWVCGPAPLRIELPPGQAHDHEARAVRSRLSEPTWFACETGAVGWTTVGDGIADALASALLRERLMERLRYEDAAVYSDVWSTVRTGCAEVLSFGAIETPSAARAERAVAQLLHTLADLAEAGPREDELETLRRQRLLDITAPGSTAGYLNWIATGMVETGEERSLDRLADEIAATTPADIRAAADVMRSSLLVAVPEEVALRNDGLAPLGRGVQAVVEGTRFVGRGEASSSSVVFSEDAIGIGTRNGKARGFAFANLAAAIAEPGGRKLLIAGDGSYLRIHPPSYEGAARILELLRERIPPELRVDLTEAEKRIGPRLHGLLGAGGGGLYIESFAQALAPDEEILETGLVHGAGGRTILMITDQRLLMVAAGRPFVGAALRRCEIDQASWSRVQPFDIRFRAGRRTVNIEACRVGFARKVVELLAAEPDGERRATPAVDADAAWIERQRTWQRRVTSAVRTWGVNLGVAAIGVGILVLGAIGETDSVAMNVLIGGSMLMWFTIAMARNGWIGQSGS